MNEKHYLITLKGTATIFVLFSHVNSFPAVEIHITPSIPYNYSVLKKLMSSLLL